MASPTSKGGWRGITARMNVMIISYGMRGMEEQGGYTVYWGERDQLEP
jgi:hypothetical protein